MTDTQREIFDVVEKIHSHEENPTVIFSSLNLLLPTDVDSVHHFNMKGLTIVFQYERINFSYHRKIEIVKDPTIWKNDDELALDLNRMHKILCDIQKINDRVCEDA